MADVKTLLSFNFEKEPYDSLGCGEPAFVKSKYIFRSIVYSKGRRRIPNIYRRTFIKNMEGI